MPVPVQNGSGSHRFTKSMTPKKVPEKHPKTKIVKNWPVEAFSRALVSLIKFLMKNYTYSPFARARVLSSNSLLPSSRAGTCISAGFGGAVPDIQFWVLWCGTKTIPLYLQLLFSPEIEYAGYTQLFSAARRSCRSGLLSYAGPPLDAGVHFGRKQGPDE